MDGWMNGDWEKWEQCALHVGKLFYFRTRSTRPQRSYGAFALATKDALFSTAATLASMGTNISHKPQSSLCVILPLLHMFNGYYCLCRFEDQWQGCYCLLIDYAFMLCSVLGTHIYQFSHQFVSPAFGTNSIPQPQDTNITKFST